MRIIARKNLVSFYELHSNCKAQLESWYAEASKAEWKSPQDVIQQFPKASAIGDSRIIFRKGNDYRLIVKINYSAKIVYICFVGTHEEYDRIDPETIWNY